MNEGAGERPFGTLGVAMTEQAFRPHGFVRVGGRYQCERCGAILTAAQIAAHDREERLAEPCADCGGVPCMCDTEQASS